MRMRNAILVAVLAAGLGWAANDVFSQEAGGAGGTVSQEEMQKRWMEYMTLDEHHRSLMSAKGTWTGEAEMHMGPGQIDKSAVKVVRRTILGGRFLVEDFSGSMMGMPFQGFSVSGYDKFKKQWVTTWCDSMGTGIYTFTGKDGGDPSKVTVATPMEENPSTGQVVSLRVSTDRSTADSETMVLSQIDQAGVETKLIEYTLTREGAAATGGTGGTDGTDGSDGTDGTDGE